MKEVLRGNFQEYLGKVRQSIRSAMFIAVDTELTGLHRLEKNGPSYHDSIQMRYNKLVDSVNSFSVTQYGISTFHWDPESKRILSDTYFFYLFPVPSPYKLGGLECRYTGFSPDGFCFLANQSFDFNKWVSGGIGCMTRPQQKVAFDSIKKRLETTSKHDPIAITKEVDIEFVNKTIDQVREFDTSESLSMTIQNGNPYLRRLIYQEVPKTFPHLTVIGTTTDAGVQGIIVSKKRLDEQEKEAMDLLELNIGFRHVLDAISESQKIVIGHNGLLDFLHTYKLMEGELPSSATEFCSSMRSIFPKLIDTKIVAVGIPKVQEILSHTALSELHKGLTNPIFDSTPDVVSVDEPAPSDSDLDSGMSSKKRSAAYHNAGYDAHITGMALAKMVCLLAKEDERDFSPDLVDGYLQPFVNKLYLMKSDVSLDLENPKDALRDTWIYFHGFPTTTGNAAIRTMFQPYVGEVTIKWIDDTSAFIVVGSAEKVEEFLALDKTSTPFENVGLGTYQDFAAIHTS